MERLPSMRSILFEGVVRSLINELNVEAEKEATDVLKKIIEELGKKERERNTYRGVYLGKISEERKDFVDKILEILFEDKVPEKLVWSYDRFDQCIYTNYSNPKTILRFIKNFEILNGRPMLQLYFILPPLTQEVVEEKKEGKLHPLLKSFCSFVNGRYPDDKIRSDESELLINTIFNIGSIINKEFWHYDDLKENLEILGDENTLSILPSFKK